MHTAENKRKSSARVHEMPYGAQVLAQGGVRFRLWAPTSKKVELVLFPDAGKDPILKAMDRQVEWFELVDNDAQAGMEYKFKIDDGIEVPDPASRCQSIDVHGCSRIIDPAKFIWTDGSWGGRPWVDTTFYELHVGTFTPEGTFAACAEQLDYLKELGITAVELMPVADFPGLRGWGYDGVLPFAPQCTYGTCDDLKRLIQSVHARQMMIFLDVVYNHFGPEGNYLHVYARKFFTDKQTTPWGAAIDFEESKEVRDFFIHNALYWLDEYNFDGLRLDAVHAIKDDSKIHFLKELAQQVHEGPGKLRPRHLVLENDDNAARFLERDDNGHAQYFAAQWNDDIHHAYHVLASGETAGYYADYTGNEAGKNAVELLHRALIEGFIYQGDPSNYRDGQLRGQKSDHLPAHAFVSFLQNHDQIGNRAFGDRIASISEGQKLEALVAIQLLAPSIPLIFMGEEWAALTPFYYFCHLGADLAPLVTEGRRNEFAKFPQFSNAKVREAIPDPCQERTFTDSKLIWSDLKNAAHQKWYQLYKHLLSLRNKTIVPLLPGIQLEKSQVEGSVIYVTWRHGGNGQDPTALTLVANLANGTEEVDRSFIGSTESAAVLFASGANGCQEYLSGKLSPWTVIWLTA